MKVKLTVHLEEYPERDRAAAVEGTIIEFRVAENYYTPREAGSLFREFADQFAHMLRTPSNNKPRD